MTGASLRRWRLPFDQRLVMLVDQLGTVGV